MRITTCVVVLYHVYCCLLLCSPFVCYVLCLQLRIPTTQTHATEGGKRSHGGTPGGLEGLVFIIMALFAIICFRLVCSYILWGGAAWKDCLYPNACLRPGKWRAGLPAAAPGDASEAGSEEVSEGGSG
jgi:hypothetical protein